MFADEDGDSIHEFAPGEQLNGREFLAGDLVIGSLRWNDVWGAACGDYDLELFGQAMGLALALGTFGSLLPAWKASRLSPVEALRYE